MKTMHIIPRTLLLRSTSGTADGDDVPSCCEINLGEKTLKWLSDMFKQIDRLKKHESGQGMLTGLTFGAVPATWWLTSPEGLIDAFKEWSGLNVEEMEDWTIVRREAKVECVEMFVGNEGVSWRATIGSSDHIVETEAIDRQVIEGWAKPQADR